MSIASLLALSLAPFEYEIGRAQHALNIYGEYVFRNEQVHRRVALDGSSIETYCALTQHRDVERTVKSGKIYWVVRVTLSDGVLSDYERGTWEGAGPVDEAEYEKLCVASTAIPAEELLLSKNHKSTGSTYDPTTDPTSTLSRSWLIGSWVIADSCATSGSYTFRSDGTYDGGQDEGTFSIVDGQLRLLLTRTNTVDDEYEEPQWAYYNQPKSRVLPVTRLGFDQARFDNKYLALRC